MKRQAPSWTVARAKAQLSRVIDQAIFEGPQVITRNGRKAVVVVATDEWERKTISRGNLAEFFAAAPLRGSGLEIRRTKDAPREPEMTGVKPR